MPLTAIGLPEDKRSVLLILVLLLPLLAPATPRVAAAAEIQPSAADRSSTGRQSLSPSSWLGESAVEVQVLKGAPPWVESTQRTYEDARWDFFSNGTFRFTPGPAAEVRNDLYPLVGSYTQVGDRVQFQAARLANLGASASLIGCL